MELQKNEQKLREHTKMQEKSNKKKKKRHEIPVFI